MNKDAQRRIVIIVIVAIICSMFGTKVDRENLAESPAITMNEWDAMIANAFGEEATASANGKSPLTGEYVAESIMEYFGDEKVEILAGEEDYEDSVDFAIANGIISRGQVQSEFSQEAADRALTIAMELYTSEAMYPEYNETVYRENVVETFDWEISNTNEDFTTLEVNSNGKVPEVGQILLLQDEYGIAKARKVVTSQQNAQGGYDLTLQPVEDISEIAEVISFSGFAEFNNPSEKEAPAVMTRPVLKGNIATRNVPMTANWMDNIGKWADNTWKDIKGGFEEGVEAVQNGWNNFTEDVDNATDSIFGVNVNNYGGKSTDLEFGLAFELNDQGTVEVASIVKQDGVETEFGVNSDGELSASISFDEVDEYELTQSSDDEEGDSEKDQEDSEKDQENKEEDEENSEDKNNDKNKEDRYEGEASARVEGTVALNDFRMATRGFFVTTDWNDEDNYLDVTVYSDVEFNLKLSGEYEGEYLIGNVKCPIPVTGGTVALEMQVYLCVSAEGEIVMKYVVNGIKAGVNVSVEDGVETCFDIRDKKFEAEAKIEIAAGMRVQPAVSFCELDLIDPSLKIMPLTASGSILPKNEGFENYPPCMELGIRGIDVYLSVGYGADSVTANLLKLINSEIETEFHLLDSSKFAIFNKVAHIETDLNGKRHKVEECTHKKPDPLGDLVEDVVGDSVENIQNEVEEQASSWIEGMVSDMLEDMLMDSCGGW